MKIVKNLSQILAHPTAYRMWQSPFVKSKFAPVLRNNRFNEIKRVLDVGCGPGTNAALFSGKQYLGLDLNPDYVAQACARFGDKFAVADVCTYNADPDQKYDFVLMNSLLHHIDTDHARRILRQLSRQLTADGHVHILDLVLPDQPGISQALALADRGDFPRPLACWKQLFCEFFEMRCFEPYPVKLAGITLWNMIYFKGSLPRPRPVDMSAGADGELIAAANHDC